MSIASRLFARILKLPPAETFDIDVDKDIEIPMPDGVTLLANRFYPRKGGNRPLIMIRTPYGRAGITGMMNGRVIAERGFQVLVQSCRGTFGSGGQLDPFHQERADGLAVIEWLKTQPWFDGQFATHGSSYQGYTQWAIAHDAGPQHKAMLLMDTSSEFRSVTYPGEALWLESALGWVNLIHLQEKSPLMLLLSMSGLRNPLKKATNHLPLNEADQVVVGKTVDFWQEWLVHDQPGDEWWADCDFSTTLPEVTTPAFMTGGWYDIMLPQTLRDYLLLKAGGQQPLLTIGPWIHGDMKSVSFNFAEALAWFRAHLLDDHSGVRELPVRIFVMGAEEWRDLPDFPPAEATPQRWHLQANGGLAPDLPAEAEPDQYRYDPADPTPHVGGATLFKPQGPMDNRMQEARADVLTYTSEPLPRPLEAIGPVQAELYVTSSLEYTDFFARLCDVDPAGKSTNVCDMLVRLVPGRPLPAADGTLKVVIDLWPTAYSFKAGHRLRLQVSSGAFPRWARNTGSGETLATAATLKAADQRVYHDPDHPSALILPIV